MRSDKLNPSKQFAQENPEVLEAFREALEHSANDLQDNHEQNGADMMAEYDIIAEPSDVNDLVME